MDDFFNAARVYGVSTEIIRPCIFTSGARMQSIINRDSTKIGHMLADLVEQQMLIAEKRTLDII